MLAKQYISDSNYEIFTKIAPRFCWIIENAASFSDILSKYVLGNQELRLSNSMCCIVGEVYCFNASYRDNDHYCFVCDNFSHTLYATVLAGKLAENSSGNHELDGHQLAFIRLPLFATNLNEFLTHLVDKHPELIERKTQDYEKIRQLIESAKAVPHKA